MRIPEALFKKGLIMLLGNSKDIRVNTSNGSFVDLDYVRVVKTFINRSRQLYLLRYNDPYDNPASETEMRLLDDIESQLNHLNMQAFKREKRVDRGDVVAFVQTLKELEKEQKADLGIK